MSSGKSSRNPNFMAKEPLNAFYSLFNNYNAILVAPDLNNSEIKAIP